MDRCRRSRGHWMERVLGVDMEKQSPDVDSLDMLRPSLEIKALHNLIGRYWNGIVPPESMMSGANMPIVLYLHEHRDSDVFQYDIERAFSITRSTASRVLGLMEKKGLITRSIVDWDARVRKIELTAAASELVVEVMRAARRLEATLFTGFAPDEQERFMDDLARMRANLVATGLGCSERTADEPTTRTKQDTTHHQQKGDEAA